MCMDPGTAAMIATAGAKLAQGISDYRTGNANARLAEQEGRSAMQAAAANAAQISNQGDRVVGQIQAQQAASGVDLSSGSAADVTAEQRRNIELDRLYALHQCRMPLGAKTAEATQARAQAKGALVSSILGMGGSLLGDAAKAGMFSEKIKTPSGTDPYLDSTYMPKSSPY